MMNGTKTRLLAKPSQDLGYSTAPPVGGQQQNGYGGMSLSPQKTQGQGSQDLDGSMILGGYKDDILNRFEGPVPRLNPVCTLSWC
jgi:hypothetical protein